MSRYVTIIIVENVNSIKVEFISSYLYYGIKIFSDLRFSLTLNIGSDFISDGISYGKVVIRIMEVFKLTVFSA